MKMGRPPLLEAQKKEKITGIRLRSEERLLLEKAAARQEMTLSTWMRNVLVKAAIGELESEQINAS